MGRLDKYLKKQKELQWPLVITDDHWWSLMTTNDHQLSPMKTNDSKCWWMTRVTTSHTCHHLVAW
jgi:hypothetical protein